MESRRHPWIRKFGYAFRGLRVGSQGESSFIVHGAATIAVAVTGVAIEVSFVEAAVLGLCVVGVVTAEFFNSSIERLALAVDDKPNEHIRDALDIAAGAVLCASIGAVIVGTLVIARRLLEVIDSLPGA